ncbi:hypothetical protein EV361DRAFT_1018068 [Lentinula raphanica]|nr:hypothetical protein EV361DRAFT_1018068 [Lentinula raphanica]
MTIFMNKNFLAPLTLAEGGRGMARQISRLVTSLSFSGMTKPKHLRGVNRKPQAVNDEVEERLQRAKEAILESTESKSNMRRAARDFNVPYATLHNRLEGIQPRKEAHEKEALLMAEEKKLVMEWIESLSLVGVRSEPILEAKGWEVTEKTVSKSWWRNFLREKSDKISPSSTSGLPRAPSPAPGPSEDMSLASQSAQMIEDPLITMPSTSSIASSLTPLAVTLSPNSSSSDAQSPSPNLRRENELLQNENTFLWLQYFNAMEMIAVLRERCERLEAVGRGVGSCRERGVMLPRHMQNPAFRFIFIGISITTSIEEKPNGIERRMQQ